MALIKCPECGKEISDKAASCPSCGCPVTPVEDVAQQESPQTPAKTKRGGGLVALFVTLGAILLFAICSGSGSKDSKGINNSENNAKSYAMIIVKDNLKSPSTAKFCNTASEMTAKNIGGYKWRVTGWVDAQNSFGATVRSDFVVELELVKEGAKSISVQIKGR